MTNSKRAAALVFLATIVLTWAGCGQSSKVVTAAQSQRDELIDVFEAYMEYTKSHQKPPQQLSDLKKLEAVHPMGVRVVRDGQYVVVWGVTNHEGGTLLAYAKDASTQGGPVLMADGTVKNMTADEVKAALPKR